MNDMTMNKTCPYYNRQAKKFKKDANYNFCDKCHFAFKASTKSKNCLQKITDDRLNNYDQSPTTPNFVFSIFKKEQDILVSSGCIGQNHRALDVGTAQGDFVAFLNHFGYEAHGIEPFEPRAQAGKSAGLSIVQGRFDSETMEKFENTKFDLICFRECIYYMDDLAETMKICSERLTANGRIYIKSALAESPYFWRGGTITGRISEACTALYTQKFLEKYLLDLGYRIISKQKVPYSASELLRDFNVPTFIMRFARPLISKFIMPLLPPDRVMIVAEMI